MKLRALARRNIDAVKAAGAKTVITSCAEGYRMWKVDYPKMLNMATQDLGFKVMHLLEFADAMVQKGALKLTKPVEARLTYHDSCGISRLATPGHPGKANGDGWALSVQSLRDGGVQRDYTRSREIS